MAVVIAALLPVFLLIVLGFILKRTLMRLETQWHGLERLTYYVLFPVLLVQTLVKAGPSTAKCASNGRSARHNSDISSADSSSAPPTPATGTLLRSALTSVCTKKTGSST